MLKYNLIIYFVCCGVYTQAQETYTEPFTLSIYGNMGFPSPEFKKAVDNSVGGTAVGFGINGLFNTGGKKKLSPVAFGADFSLSTFGRDKIESTSSAPPYKTTFSIISISGVSRIILTSRTTGFVPFVDGMLGLKTFHTKTKIDKDALSYVLGDTEEEIIGVTNNNGLGYGVGLGWYTRKPKDVGSGSFSLRAMYLWGERIKYIKRGSMQVDNSGNLTFETGYTYTNMILIQLGITLN